MLSSKLRPVDVIEITVKNATTPPNESHYDHVSNTNKNSRNTPLVLRVLLGPPLNDHDAAPPVQDHAARHVQLLRVRFHLELGGGALEEVLYSATDIYIY